MGSHEAERAGEGPDPPGPRDASTSPLRLLLQTALGVVAILGLVMALAYFFRAPLETIGLDFVRRFGLAGMFVGTFLADAFSFPVPPQFYLLTAVTSKGPQAPAIATVCIASLLAGNTGYHLATRLSSVGLFRRFVARSRGRIDPLFQRYGYWAVAIGSVTPIPFSMLCYLAGLYRMPYRLFAVLALFRVPRILFFYVLIRAGWA